MSALSQIAASLVTGLLFSVGACGAPSDDVQSRPDLRHGEELFQNCTACHQANGAGIGRMGIPVIAGQYYRVVLKELTDFRAERRLDMRMESVVTKHELRGSQDFADVAGYVASLPRLASLDLGNGQHVGEGKLAYERLCVRCHGVAGEGDERQLVPRLAGQHYTYLLNQTDAMVGRSRLNVTPDHSQLITTLSDHEMTGVADYLARLKPAAEAETR